MPPMLAVQMMERGITPRLRCGAAEHCPANETSSGATPRLAQQGILLAPTPRGSRYAALSPVAGGSTASTSRGAHPPRPRGRGIAAESGGAVAQHEQQLCCATAPTLHRQVFSP